MNYKTCLNIPFVFEIKYIYDEYCKKHVQLKHVTPLICPNYFNNSKIMCYIFDPNLKNKLVSLL